MHNNLYIQNTHTHYFLIIALIFIRFFPHFLIFTIIFVYGFKSKNSKKQKQNKKKEKHK